VVTTQSKLPLALQNKVQHAVKKQNMTIVHILTLHSVLITPLIFAHNKHPKSFNTKHHTVTISVSVNKLHWSKKVLSHEEKCLFLMYFWTLNSNMFPEFLNHPHLSLSDSESSDEDGGQAKNNMDCDPTFAGVCSSNEPHLLTQGDLNNIVRDLNLLKKQAELLGSRLKG
jgi:hypothetical protein